MELVIKNHVIDYNVFEILKEVRSITGGRYLNHMNVRGDNIAVTCPYHKDGHESHPSGYVYIKKDNPDVPYGFFRCFTCGEQGNLDWLVAHCLNCSIEQAQSWLIDNYSATLLDQVGLDLPEIVIGREKPKIEFIDESTLDQYAYIHPYILNRKVSREIMLAFKVGWDKEADAITFPVWDDHNNLIGITRRNVKNKYFSIPKGMGKPIYLLNFVRQYSIREVYVVESQIDALYLWSIGKPAVAMFGTGSKDQYKILRHSGIRVYHLAFDGDLAGKHGAQRFINNMPGDIFIDVCILPDGKDINDLSEEEINKLEKVDRNVYK